MKQRIIEGARGLFVQYGVRSVSMDDVARALSVSKKTLYQYFKNKDELVTETVDNHMQGEVEVFKRIKDVSTNAFEQMFKLSKCMRESSLKINPSLLYDLQKYHPDAWDVFREFKDSFITGQIIDNIERGIAEGYYRKEINPKILARLRVAMFEIVFNQHDFNRDEFDFVEVHTQLFDHFLHGLLSEKGKKYYHEYQIQEEKITSK